MALNGNDSHASEGNGSEFDHQCRQDLFTHHVQEKKKRTIKQAAKQVPEIKQDLQPWSKRLGHFVF